ncbi:hypothetical protein [Sanguibacter sp. Z1732]|uniref:hypothetical protein n=1 Tax=Sanguibacter sp. Z1732 TaxID=3435412 RepID=UPI003D9C8EEF
MTDLYPPTGQTPPLDWITACEDDTWSAYQGALADRDRARNIAVALEQESAELRAERLRSQPTTPSCEPRPRPSTALSSRWG